VWVSIFGFHFGFQPGVTREHHPGGRRNTGAICTSDGHRSLPWRCKGRRREPISALNHQGVNALAAISLTGEIRPDDDVAFARLVKGAKQVWLDS